MAKSPTSWSGNASKRTGVTYSSSATTYSSTSVAYSSLDAALDDFGKLASSWTNAASKTAISWTPNPTAITNLYLYDSGTKTYDSTTNTYDGVVSGQAFSSQKTATVWSAA